MKISKKILASMVLIAILSASVTYAVIQFQRQIPTVGNIQTNYQITVLDYASGAIITSIDWGNNLINGMTVKQPVNAFVIRNDGNQPVSLSWAVPSLPSYFTVKLWRHDGMEIAQNSIFYTNLLPGETTTDHYYWNLTIANNAPSGAFSFDLFVYANT